MPVVPLDDPSRMKAFKYAKPDTGDRPKKVEWLARTDRISACVQVVNKGGDNKHHSHGYLDGFWFVLKGRVRFYSDFNTLEAELGPNEGILIPRGVKYWFESASSEQLELLQIE